MIPFFTEAQFATRPPGRLVPGCNACGLFKTCSSPKMTVAGEGRRGILVIGEAPGADEDRKGLPFVGASGRLLQESLRKFDVDLFRDCWIINAVRCRPPENKLPQKAIHHCHPLLVDDLKALKPTLIIPVGKAAVESLLSYLWRAHDLGGVSRWTGWQIPSQKINAWVCPNFHPSFVLRRDQENSDRDQNVRRLFFDRYLERALRLEDRPWDKIPDYRKRVIRCFTPDDAIPLLRRMTDSDKPVAFDYENTTLKPDSKHARIVCCSVYDGKECVSFPWLGRAVEIMGELLRSKTPKIGANLKHEEKWTLKEFGHGVTNWAFDTVLGAHTLDSRGGTSSVKFQAFARLGMDAYDEGIKPFLKSKSSNQPNRITEIPLEDLLLYGGLDSVVEYHLAKLQAEEMGVKL